MESGVIHQGTSPSTRMQIRDRERYTDIYISIYTGARKYVWVYVYMDLQRRLSRRSSPWSREDVPRADRKTGTECGYGTPADQAAMPTIGE